jgi:hypothetical protein
VSPIHVSSRTIYSSVQATRETKAHAMKLLPQLMKRKPFPTRRHITTERDAQATSAYCRRTTKELQHRQQQEFEYVMDNVKIWRNT